MHRRTIGLIALMAAVAVAGFALQGCTSSAQTEEPFPKTGMPCPMHGKMAKEKMMCMCPMCRMMMGKSLIATSDGGVVVLAGDKLMKFDKDLNLVKETKIKMDFEGMEKERPEHKGMMPKRCPMEKGPPK
jgi:hypothetical protein